MKNLEIIRLVWLNLIQNKSKVLLTSVGIIVGSATIMLVIAIGTGGKEEIAEQFKNLNAGAIDVSYESNNSQGFGGFGGGGSSGRSGGGPSGGPSGGGPSGGGMPSFGGGMPSFGGGFPGFGAGNDSNRMNQENIVLSDSDVEDIKVFVPGISDATISYTTTSTVDGGELDESESKTIAGVKSNYAEMSNLELAIGEFITDENDELKEKVCVLGYDVAREVFGSVYNAYDATIYIDDRPYVVSGVISQMGTVSSGISPDSSVFIPYKTGSKYLTGSRISPTITVIAEDVDNVSSVMENITSVLADSYPNAEFTMSDAGSKMEAASKSNETLTLLLYAMAAIVFVVGGIGIMNVLFVSVKERTNEIGILKAIGCSRRDILMEFLLEASGISLVGAIVGVMAALAITPLIEQFSVRVSLSVGGAVIALLFGIFTGSVFGFYPAYKASRLIPVEALNAE